MDEVLDEHNFRIEDEVTEDIGEQIEVKQYQCGECEYHVKYLTTWKGINFLNTKESRVPVINVHDTNDDEIYNYFDEAEKRQLNYNKWHLEKLMLRVS